MLLKLGSSNIGVETLKANLIALGYKLSADNMFDLDTDVAVRAFQKLAKLTVDGLVGPLTQAAIKNAVANIHRPTPIDNQNPAPTVPPTIEKGVKPFWVAFEEARLGWSEFDHDRELSIPGWSLCGLNYTTCIGTAHAWCGKEANEALCSGGLKGPKGAAGARNWEGFGESCDYICGAFLPIRHASGGRHITIFLYWIDEKKKIAACLGGNQNNKVQISQYNLSGNKAGHDEVVTGPRWPKGYPQSNYVYPRGKSEKGGSTR